MTDKPLYRCKRCNTVTPMPSHHKMSSCECGAISVDHGWYGSRVVWRGGGKREDWAEIVAPEAPEAPPAAVLDPAAVSDAANAERHPEPILGPEDRT